MKRIRELEVWSAPGTNLPQDFGKLVFAPQMWEAGWPKEVVLGLSLIPGPTDVENLRLCLDAGELFLDEFQHYCRCRDLPADARSEVSAESFLQFSYGVAIAWVHLNEDQEEQFVPLILAQVRSAGLALVDPALGACLL